MRFVELVILAAIAGFVGWHSLIAFAEALPLPV